MKIPDEDVRKVEAALLAAHGKRVEPEASSSFSEHVMRDIRRIEAGRAAGQTPPFLYDRTVWRFAASACLIALVLVAYAAFTGLNPEYELARAVVDNSTGVLLVESLGVL